MPNIKSAKKRVLVIAKKNADNGVQRTIVKSAIKKINAAIDVNNIEEAERLLPETYAALDKAASKGIISKNAASNKKSGIAKRIADIKAGKKEVIIKKDNKTIAAEKAKAAAEAREAQRAEYAKKAAEKKAAAEEAKKAEEAAKKPAKKTTTKKADSETAAKKTTAKKTTAKKAEDGEAAPKKTTTRKSTKKTEEAPATDAE